MSGSAQLDGKQYRSLFTMQRNRSQFHSGFRFRLVLLLLYSSHLFVPFTKALCRKHARKILVSEEAWAQEALVGVSVGFSATASTTRLTASLETILAKRHHCEAAWRCPQTHTLKRNIYYHFHHLQRHPSQRRPEASTRAIASTFHLSAVPTHRFCSCSRMFTTC